MRIRDYEVLAKMIYDEPLTMWCHKWFSGYYILTEHQLMLFNMEVGGFYNGESPHMYPPEFVSRAWTKKDAWKKASQCKK